MQQLRREGGTVGKDGKCVLCYSKNCRDAGMPWPPPDTEEQHYLSALEEAPTGTLVHRTWHCSAHDAHRREHAPQAMMDIAAAQDTTGAQAFERGIFPALDPIVPALTQEATFTWILRPEGGTYRGNIYTDGSRIDGTDSRTGRNGWTFVVTDEIGRPIAKTCGVPPAWIDDILGTEAWALLQAGTGAEPGCTIYCDCHPCVAAVHAGPGWATSDKRKHARVRGMVMNAWDGLRNDQLIWILAHCSDDAAGTKHRGDGQPMTLRDIKGNREADRLAKLAAETHRVPEDIREQLLLQARLITETVRWIGRASTWPTIRKRHRTETLILPKRRRPLQRNSQRRTS